MTRREPLSDRVVARLVHGTPLWGPRPPAPPAPPGSWLLGHAVEGWNRPLELFLRCMTDFDGAPVVRLRFGPSFYYLLHDPELVRRVLLDNHRNYVKSRYFRGMKLVMGEGLVTSEGELWRRQRKLVQPAFHRERVAALAPVMAGLTRDALARLKARGGAAVDMDQELGRLTLLIACRTLFGSDVEVDAEAIHDALRFASAYAESVDVMLPRWLPTPRGRRFRRAVAVFDRAVERLVAERGRDASRGDVLSLLMAARDEESARGMSERQLRDEAITLLLAGHETTANTLCWTLYLLARHPEVERRLRAHVREALGDGEPDPEAFGRLGYATQVVQESMRLYPASWVIEREALADDDLGGHRVPAGATVAVSQYALHRNPSLWPNPEAFDPDRFTPEALRAIPRCAYLPFGAGPRQCVGNGLAMMEATVVLSLLVRELHFDLVPGHPVEPEPVSSLRPRYGMRMMVRPA